MHYLDEGPRDAPIVLMLHGNPTWSYYFRSLVSGLSTRYRCIVPDHVGMGLSARPLPGAYPFTLSRRVDDLAEFVDKLGLREWTLIAHDWGGMLGMALAVRAPHRVTRLVLGNTGAFPLPAQQRVPWQIRACRGPLANVLVRYLNAFCRGAAYLCPAKKMDATVRNAYLAPYATPQARQAVFEFVRDIPLSEAAPSFGVLREVESAYPAFSATPALLIWGLRDFVFTERFLERFQELLPHAEIASYPQAGHYLLEDCPEAVLARVERFLEA